MTPWQLIDTASRHQVFLEGLKTGKVNDFNEVFDDIDKATSDVLRALDVDQLSDMARSEFEKMLDELREQHQILLDKQIDSFLEEMPEVAAYAAAFEARAMKSVMTAAGRKRVKDTTAGKAYSEARKRPVQATGDLLEPLVRDFAARSISTINKNVRLGYDQGRTVPQILAIIRGTAPLKFKDGVTAVSRRHAATVVRTAVQHVAATAREVTWEENSDIVIGVEWVSTLDGKTSAQCRSLDGRKFKLKEGPRPPIHPNCRSTTAPDMDPTFDFLDKGATRAGGAGQGGEHQGPTDAATTYHEWLLKQPAGFQDEILGTERGKLLRDGGLTAQRFAELQLDKNFKPITLDEMKKLEPLAFQRAGLTELFDIQQSPGSLIVTRTREQIIRDYNEFSKKNPDVAILEDVAPFLKGKNAGVATIKAFSSGAFTEINLNPDLPATKAMQQLVDELPPTTAPYIHRAVAFSTEEERQTFIQTLNGTQRRSFASWTEADPTRPGQTPMNNIALDLASQFGDKTVILTLENPHSAKDVSFIYDGKPTTGAEQLTSAGLKTKIKEVIRLSDGKIHVRLVEDIGKTKSVTPPKSVTVTELTGRPGPGTMTGKVWDVADKLKTTLGRTPTRQEVMKEARSLGVNDSTIGVQFGKWRKAVGDTALGGSTKPAVEPARTVLKQITQLNTAVETKLLAPTEKTGVEKWTEIKETLDLVKGTLSDPERIRLKTHLTVLKNLELSRPDGKGGIDVEKLSPENRRLHFNTLGAYKVITGEDYNHARTHTGAKETVHALFEKVNAPKVNQTVRVNEKSTPSHLRKRLDEASDFLHKVTNDRFKKTTVYLNVMEENGRANYVRRNVLGASEIHIAPKDTASTVVHELAHHIEAEAFVRSAASGPVVERVVAFLKKRQGTEPRKPRHALFPNELIFDDEWVSRGGDNYASRVYMSSGIPTATEVISMGAERLYNDPVEFYRKDPEHFEITLRTLMDLW